MAKIIIRRYLDDGKFNYRSEDYYEDQVNPDSETDKDEGYEKCIESLRTLMKQLPKAYEEIIEDCFFKEKSASQICEERNYNSSNSFSSMKSQALRALLKLVEECDNHHELKFWLKRMENKNKNDKKQ